MQAPTPVPLAPDHLDPGLLPDFAASARRWALHALCQAEPDAKVKATHALQANVLTCAGARIDPTEVIAPETNAAAARAPGAPRVDPPMQVPHRSPFTPEGLAALVHAICHIEFNAINLALDAVWRFAGMPEAFYRDWLRVADEEATHFGLLRGLAADAGPRLR